jgi:2-polyprenyl-3-methyl-5-hydroxy-6-metoxy-1,4-benzoquinol methylase
MSESAEMTREWVHSESARPLACPICASPGHWSFDSNYVEVHRCESEECAHLFAVGVDSKHGVMHEVGTQDEESIFTERNERLIAFWKERKFVTAGAKLLDVGAGTGHLARSLRSLAPEVDIHCVEESEALRDQLNRQEFAVSEQLNSVSLDLSFNAVVLIEVIEHVPDPVDFLDRLRKLLRPEGRIFLTTPCGELRNGSRTTNAYDTPEHVQFFTEKSLRLAVQKAGFSNITFEYIDALYPRGPKALSLATLMRLATKAVRPFLRKFEGPRHLTGFIDP